MHYPLDFPMDSLLRVRRLPNGRIDFLSVDEMARLDANTIGHFDEEFLGKLMEQKAHQESPPSTEGDKPEV